MYEIFTTLYYMLLVVISHMMDNYSVSLSLSLSLSLSNFSTPREIEKTTIRKRYSASLCFLTNSLSYEIGTTVRMPLVGIYTMVVCVLRRGRRSFYCDANALLVL